MRHAPDNLKITQSLGGLYDAKLDTSRPHARIFDSIESRDASGYENGNENDLPAINGVTRIGLVYHGTKKLSEAQTKYFK
jgi:hypothetical protein